MRLGDRKIRKAAPISPGWWNLHKSKPRLFLPARRKPRLFPPCIPFAPLALAPRVGCDGNELLHSKELCSSGAQNLGNAAEAAGPRRARVARRSRWSRLMGFHKPGEISAAPTCGDS